MRKGTLTDAETLRLYEHGAAMIALCVKEGMTPYGIISRIARARRHRTVSIGGQASHRLSKRRAPQPTYDTFDSLRAAVDALEAQTAALPRRRRAA